jgi:RNA polymerase sigma factor for flagellar operon FliA
VLDDDENDPLFDGPTEADSPESEPAYMADEATREQSLSPAEREALFREGLPLVKPIARTLARELGRLADADELESVGLATLVEILRFFDPSRASFGTFVRRKLRWAMLDSVRRDTHGRSWSARARALEGVDRVAETVLRDKPDPALPESSHARRLRGLLGAQAAAMVVGLTAPFAEEASSDGPTVTVAPGESPESLLLRTTVASAIREALGRLPERQRELVERHYFGGERFDDIAASLRISKSWASRLHACAMTTLAEALRDHR